MDPKEILEQARDTLTVRRVFGEPIEHDGVVVVPVAHVRGGGGAGSGEGRPDSGNAGSGRGGGWGVDARPAGVYVITQGEARWRPAVDPNRIILGAQLVVIAALVLRLVIGARRRGPFKRG
ncbi:MAG: sporulation protein [Candidatus Dormibacteraeota bacterium]|nr:sporulation protein [Candidatus Dormibacteraeota bacterium]